MSDAVKIAAAKRLRKDCAELRELATNPPGAVPPIVTYHRRPPPKTPRRPAQKPPTKAAQKLVASRGIPIEAIEPGPKGQVTAVEVRAYIDEHNGDLPTAEAVKAAQAEVKAKKPRAGYATAFVSGKAWVHLEKRLSTLARDATKQARIIMGTDFDPKIYSSLPPLPLTQARPDLVGPFLDAKRRDVRHGVLVVWARAMADGHCPTCGKRIPKPRGKNRRAGSSESYLACTACRKNKDLDAIVDRVVDAEEWIMTAHGREVFHQPQWPGVVFLPGSPFGRLQPCVGVTDDFMMRLETLEAVAESLLAAEPASDARQPAAAGGDGTTATDTRQPGEWSAPMTLSLIQNRLGTSMDPRKVRKWLEETYGLHQVSRQSFQVRLDTMPANLRTRLESRAGIDPLPRSTRSPAKAKQAKTT